VKFCSYRNRERGKREGKKEKGHCSNPCEASFVESERFKRNIAFLNNRRRGKKGRGKRGRCGVNERAMAFY